MIPLRFLRAASLAFLAAAPVLAHAQNDFDFARAATAARERARMELEEIYAQGQQKLTPPWRGLSVQDDGAVFIRAETVSAGKNQVSIWTDRELPVPGYVDKEKPYISVRERFVADCGTRRLGLVEWVYYSGRYGSGAMITHEQNAQPDMREILPDSLEEQIRSVACPKPPPKPAPKPRKKIAKPKTGDEIAQEPKDAAKEGSKAAEKTAPKKDAPKQTAKKDSSYMKKTAIREKRTPVRRKTPPIKKPATSEDAGKATTTAGRR